MTTVCNWSSDFSRDYRCRLEPLPDSEFCILHESGDKSAEAFVQALGHQLDSKAESPNTNPCLSFVGYRFPDQVRLSNSHMSSGDWEHPIILQSGSRLDFEEAEFARDFTVSRQLDIAVLDMQKAHAHGAVVLERARISELDLRSASIELSLNLRGLRADWIHLSDIAIVGDLTADGVQVANSVLMHGATVKKSSSGPGSGDIYFDNSQVAGSMLLLGVATEGQFRMQRVRVAGSINLHEARIGGDLILFEASIRHRLRLMLSELGGTMNLQDCEIGTTIWMPTSRVEVSKANFNGCEARHLTLEEGKPVLRGDKAEKSGIRIIDPESAVSFWRFAQRTWVRDSLHHKADLAFYFERMRAWEQRRGRKKPGSSSRVDRAKAWFSRRLSDFLWLSDTLFLRATSGYGTSLSNIIATWLFVSLLFGTIFALFPSLTNRADVTVWSFKNWVEALHYSVTNFTTLGLGNIAPSDSYWGMALASLEALAGALLIALAVLVIGRRFMRQ